MTKRKEIKVGNYQHGRVHPKDGHEYSDSCLGGTNNWNVLIQKAGLENKKLEVILREI